MAEVLDSKAAGARRFEGQVAVVTGGGQGIGSATARRLVQEGASIVVGDMVAETSERVRQEIREFGGACEISIGDLSKWENAEALMARAHEAFGRIDVLANIAGGTIWFQSLQYYTPDQIQAEIDRSFWTAMWCCRAALPYMIDQGSGSIVNIATHAVTGRFRVPYAAAKAGQIGLTTSLAREVAHLGIRVNCVAPSGTAADDRVTPRDYGVGINPARTARQRARRTGRVPLGDAQLRNPHGEARRSRRAGGGHSFPGIRRRVVYHRPGSGSGRRTALSLLGFA